MKRIMALLTVVLVMMGYNGHASAAEYAKVVLDNKPVQLNNAKMLTEKGRILLPVRAVQESMGAQLTYDNKTKKIHSAMERKGETTKVTYKLHSPFVTKHYSSANGKVQLIEQIDVPAKVKNGKAYLPLRSVTESLGYDVKWNAATKTVSISSNSSIKPKDAKKQFQVSGDISKVKEIEKEIFFLTNKERAARGLPTLMLDVKNTEIAQLKSKDFNERNYFDHNSPTYGSPFDMIKKFGVNYAYAGENIAAGYQSAEDVMDAWMNSPGHKENILHPEYRRLGVGYFEGSKGYRTYYTQIFSANFGDQ